MTNKTYINSVTVRPPRSRPDPKHLAANQTRDTELAALYLMVEAAKAGTAWAEALKVGDIFLGATPEAKARYSDPRAQRLFTFTALDVLDKHRLCTTADDCVIIEYSLNVATSLPVTNSTA